MQWNARPVTLDIVNEKEISKITNSSKLHAVFPVYTHFINPIISSNSINPIQNYIVIFDSENVLGEFCDQASNSHIIICEIKTYKQVNSSINVKI